MLRLNKAVEAEPALLEAHALAVDRVALAPNWEKDYPAATAGRLVELYSVLDRPMDAEKWRAVQLKLIPKK